MKTGNRSEKAIREFNDSKNEAGLIAQQLNELIFVVKIQGVFYAIFHSWVGSTVRSKDS